MKRKKQSPEFDIGAVEEDRSRLSTTSLAARIVIDFLEGTTEKNHAVAFARGFIDNHFDAPEVAGWYVCPYEGGFVYEVHEGGAGRAFTPAALDILRNDPEVTVVVPMARRYLLVKRTPSGSYASILLPEGMDPSDENTIEVEPGPPLKRYKTSGMVVFQAGLAAFATGFAMLLVTTLVYSSGVLMRHLPIFAERSPDNLPITQWNRINQQASVTRYIKSLRFENGRWTVEQAERVVVDDEPPTLNAPN